MRAVNKIKVLNIIIIIYAGGIKEMKIYEIKYIRNSEELITTCAEYSLSNITKTIEDSGGKIISINLKTALKGEDENKQIKSEIQKYYLKKYNAYYKKYKRGKISNEVFFNIKETLKKLNDENITIKEFQNKFEQFLKENNL